MTEPSSKPASKPDKKLIEYLPENLRRQPWVVEVARWLDWLSTPKGAQWGFGALVLALAVINFLPNLNNPRKPFWDESYYLTSAQRMKEGTVSFASHPPLGFMFMALGEAAVGDNEDISDAHILSRVKKTSADDVPKEFDYVGIRLPSALFAVASCVMLYLILVIALKDAFMAFVFSLFFAFENGFIVHFRAAHLDSYQVGFVMAGILLWVRLFLKKTTTPIRDYALFGAMIGLSFMVKVNSSVVMLLGGLTLLRDLWEVRGEFTTPEKIWRNFSPSLLRFGSMMSAFAVVIFAVFTLNTVITAKPTDPKSPAGERDLSTMSQPYKDYINGRTGLTPQVWWASISDYSAYMKNDFTGVTQNEPNGQTALTWPWWTKTISYRWDHDGHRTAYTLFIGNQVVWRVALLGLIVSFAIIIQRRGLRPKWLKLDSMDKRELDLLEAVTVMYLVFMLIHAYLGTQRVMYVYHYFIGLILSFIMLSLSFKIICDRFTIMEKQRLNILTGLSVAVALGFILYAPFSYHTKMSRQECELRNWPSAIISCMPPVKK